MPEWIRPMTPAEHNAAEWLVVRWEENARGQGFLAGWYVVRCCPCHFGDRVTLPRGTRADAERVRRVMLGLEGRQPGSARRKWAPSPTRPAAVLAGQIWRRNRTSRDERYLRVLDVDGDKAWTLSVMRSGDGWVTAGRRPYPRVISVRRMLAGGSAQSDSVPYTLVPEVTP